MARLSVFKDPRELLELRELLYGDIEQQKRGLAKAKAYQVRGNLPPSVHTTCLLISAMHSDVPGADFYAIRQVYAMSLIRFVNEMLDSQQAGRSVVPLHILAEQIHLPSSFVELRHASTHEDIPSVYLLRQMAHRAMDWLMENFWALQADGAASKVTAETGFGKDAKRIKTNKSRASTPSRSEIDSTEDDFDGAGQRIKEFLRDWRRVKRTEPAASVPSDLLEKLNSQWENDASEFLDVCINRNVLVPGGTTPITKKAMAQVIALWFPLFRSMGHEVCESLESAIITALSPREWPLKKNEDRKFPILESWALKLAPYLNARSTRQLRGTLRPWSAQILALSACEIGDPSLYKVAQEMAALVNAEIIDFSADQAHIPGWRLLKAWTPKPLGA